MLHQRYNAKIRPLGARVKNESFSKLAGLVNPKIHANLLPAVVKSYMRSSLCNIIVVSVLVSGTHFLVQITQQWTLHTHNDNCLDLDDLLCLGLLSAQKRLADTSECVMEGP